MNTEKIKEIRKKIWENKPLIHCITNPISINQCANLVLSIGARPMMAEHPMEVKAITKTSKALLLNLGNITDVRMKSMEISAITASEDNIPFIIDAVGISCSKLRREYLNKLLKISKPSIIKGNYSEIMALFNENYLSSGVDADASLTSDDIKTAASEISKKTGAVILASGKTDIIAFKDKIASVNNGTFRLSTITGTGCMLGALAAVFLSDANAFDAAVLASLYMGVSGEKADTDKGSGSFLLNMFDALSTLETDEIERRMNISYEKF